MFARVLKTYEELIGFDFKRVIVFEVEPKDLKELPNECELTITKYSPNRNVDQNARYWATVGEISKITGISTTEIHNQLLTDYGELETEDGKPIEVVMDMNYDHLNDKDLHLFPTGETVRIDGKLYAIYYKLLNSKNMTRKQFSRLLDGAIYERQNLEMQ